MLKRITTQQVRLGMYIHEFCGAWIDHPFWKTRFLINDERDLQRVISSGVPELIIDVRKGLDVAAAAREVPTAEAPADTELSPSSNVRTPLAEEIEQAKRLCARSKAAVIDMFNDARMGKAIEVSGAQELVDEISDSVMRQPSALISLARLKTSDEYTYMHSVAVCAMMIALARQLSLEEEQVREAGMAGLLHDVGKMLMPTEVLNKPGRLTDYEFDIMRTHPAAGYKMLLKSDFCAGVMEVCLHHHEKVDGSGYPDQLQGEQISLLARMAAVCDVYDAITSNRPYKRGWDPAESIRRMAQWQGHFDPMIFQAFVKSIGIYPTGSLVRLQSGRLAVVLEQHAQSLLTPKVKVFFSVRNRLPIAQEIIDLSRSGETDRILARENPEDWRFPNLDRLWSGLEQKQGSHFD